MRLVFISLCGLVLCSACQSSDGDPEPVDESFVEAPAEGEGFQFAMDAVAPAGSEVWLCAVYPIPTEVLSPVNSVYYKQNPGMHHMTLSTTGITGPEIEYGMYDCNELYEDQMDEFTMFFGSQDAEDTMQLPEGVVARLPPNIDIIHEVHYVNTSAEDVNLYSRVNAYTIDDEDVEVGIWGGQVRDETIEIPAQSEHTEWTRCVMNRDVDVHFLASHTHQLGVEFTVAPFDGTETGEIFYRNNDWHDPKIVQYDPPMHLPEGTGFEYACTWNNPSSEPVSYGLTALDEMCNLALVHTPEIMSARCEVVETSDGVLWE